MTAFIPHRRPGLTLTEVLVAMFVMALGLISLLTLFPLGAVQIGFALRDDRCAQTAAQADAYVRAWWQTKVVDPYQESPPKIPSDQQHAFWAMDDSNLEAHILAGGSDTALYRNKYIASTYRLNWTAPTVNGARVSPTSAENSGDTWVNPNPPTYTTALTDPNYYVRQGAYTNTASYPVFLDPLTVFSRQNSRPGFWLGYKDGTEPPLIPRRTMSTVPFTAQGAIETCSLLDDITYDTNGTPLKEIPTGPFTRDGRYNWSAVIQRPANDRRTTANLTILVFDGRPPLITLPDAEVVVALTNNAARTAATWAAGQSSVTLTAPAPADPNAPSVVRRGGWLMDGSVSPAGLRNAHFYRIVGLTETGTPNQYKLDFEPPIRAATNTDTEATTLYFFAGLAEVFARPPLVPNPLPGQ